MDSIYNMFYSQIYVLLAGMGKINLLKRAVTARSNFRIR